MLRKIFKVFVSLMMIVGLSACTKSKASHQDAGKYMIYYLSSGETEVDEETLKLVGFDIYYLELKEDGTFTLMTDSAMEGKWEDGVLKSGVSKMEYTKEGNDIIVLVPQEGVTMKFKKEGSTESTVASNTNSSNSFKKPSETEKTAEPEKTPEPTEIPLVDIRTPMQKYWGGDWYGWLWVYEGTGNYESYSNYSWDAMAKIGVNENNDAHMLLWYEGLSQDNPVGEIDFHIDDTNGTGIATSTGGWMFVNSSTGNGDIHNGDWVIDPSEEDYENFLGVDGYYRDGSGYMKYMLVLRPWGQEWEDFAKEATDDALPYYYRSWYEPLIKDGWAMPKNLNEEADHKMADDLAAFMQPAETSQPTAGTETAKPTETTAPSTTTTTTTTTTTNESDGVTTREMCMRMYVYCIDMGADNWKVLFTPEYLDQFAGVKGQFNEKRSEEGKQVYNWYSDSDNVTVTATFKEYEGAYKLNGIVIAGAVSSSDYEDLNPYENLPAPNLTEKISFADGAVTMMAPKSNWQYQEDAFGQRLYHTELAKPSSSNYFEVAVFDSLEDLNKKIGNYKDLVDVDGTSVDGVALSGRFYNYSGRDTTEYYGQMNNGKWVSIRLVKIKTLYPNSDYEAIFNSIKFN